MVGPEVWAKNVGAALLDEGFRVGITASAIEVARGRRPPEAVVLLDPARPGIELVRDRLPTVPILVVRSRPSTLLERCWLYDRGVTHVLDPPLLVLELGARLRSCAVARSWSRG